MLLRVIRRPWIVCALFLACGAGGCGTTPGKPIDLGAGAGGDGGPFQQECTTLCLRPSDCAVAFPDGNLCPPNFLCARTFNCRD